MNRRLVLAAWACLMIGVAVMAGCEGIGNYERTPEQAKQIADAQVANNQGATIADQGTAMIAQGRTLKDKGDTAGGDKMIADGEVMQKQGRTMMAQAKRSKMIAQLPPGTSLPPAPATVPATQKVKKTAPTF